MRSPTLLAFTIALGAAAAAALAGTPAEIKKKDTLTALTSPGFLPFEMKDKDGKLVGFDVAIAERLRGACGVSKLAWKEVPFEKMLDALAAGEGDIAISGISITDERKKKVDFSEPYAEVGKALLRSVKKGAVGEVKSIATAAGTTSVGLAKMVFPGAKLETFPTEGEAAKAVLAGKADAMLFDEPFLRAVAKRHADQVSIEALKVPKESIGVAVAKGNTELVKVLNGAIADLRKHGDLAALQKEWFEDMRWVALVPGD